MNILFIIICYFLIICYSSSGMIESQILQNRLEKVGSFCADFTQQVIDINSIIIQEAYGKLWIKYPCFFCFCFVHPNKNIYILNGNILWCYDSVVNQVTINDLRKIAINLPLFHNNKFINYDEYLITQDNDVFALFSKNVEQDLINFIIEVDYYGIIKKIVLFEYAGIQIKYKLSNFKNIPINNKKFVFVYPKGVVIDDQR